MIHLFAWTYVFAVNRSSKLSKAYLIYMGSIMGWLLMDLTGRIIFNDITPLYYLRIMSIFWLYLGIGMLNFIYVLLEKKYDPLFKYLAWLYPLSLIISLTTKMSILPSRLFLPTLIVGICVPSFYGIFLIIDRLRKTKNEILGLQLKLIIAGIISAIVIGLATDVIPIYLGFKFDWRLGSAITCIQAFFILPALLKYHFIAFPVGEVAFGLFTKANEAIIAIDNKGIILRTNNKANQLFNIHPENIQVKNITDYIKDYSPKDKFISKETVLMENSDIAINISQTNLQFGGYEQGKVMVIRDITERVQTALALTKSEDKYRTLIESTSDIIYNLDISGNYVYVNPAFEKYSGYKFKDAIGMSSITFIRPDFRTYAQNIFLNLFKQRNNQNTTETLLTIPTIAKNGAEYWMELNVKLILAGEWVAGFNVISRDITERRKTEDALKESEERYRQLVENSTDMIYKTDKYGNYTFVNQVFINVSGLSVAEILKMNCFDKVPEKYQEDVKLFYRKQFEKKQPVSYYELPCYIANNKIIWVGQYSSLELDESGEPIGFSNTAHDITDRLKAENNLKASEDRYRKLVKHLPDAIVVHDGKIILFANDQAADMAGVKSGKILHGQPISAFIHPEYKEILSERVKKIVDGKTLDPIEVKLQNSDGKSLFVETQGVLINFDNKPAIQTVFRDITEKKIASEALKSSETRLRKLIETSPDGIAINDFKNIYFINEAGAEIVGEKPEDIINKPFLKYITPKEKEKLKDIINKLKNGEKISSFDITVLRADGTERIIEAKGTTTTHNGKPATLTFLRDITERIQAENAVISSRARLNEAQKMARLGSFQYNLLTDKVLWSDTLYHLYGLDRKIYTATNKKFLNEVVHPDDRKYVKELIASAIRNNESSLDYFHKIITPDGKEKIMHALVQIIYDGKDKAVIINGSAQDVTEIYNTRQKLEKSEKNYRELVELSPDAVMITDKKNILYVNKAFIKMMGGENPNEFLTKDIYHFIHHGSIEKVKEDLKKMDDDLPIGTTQIKAFKLDGSIIYADVRGMNTQFNNQQSIMCSIRDVTNRIIAEKQLKQSELSLSKAQKIAQLGSWEYEYTSDKLIFSDECKFLFGFKKNDEITVEKYWNKVHPEDHEWLKKKWEEAKIKKTAFHEIYRVFADKKKMRYLKEQAEFIVDENGGILKAIGTALDITELEFSRIKLEQNEEKYRNLYNHSPAAYFSIGLDGVIVNCNNRVKELLGYTPKQLIGKPVFNLYSSDGNGIDKAKVIFEKFVNGSTIVDEEVQMTTKKKKDIWVSITVEPVKDDGGRIIESRSMVTNITDRKESEEELSIYRNKLRELSSHIQDLQEEERSRIAREIHDELGQNLTSINMDIEYLKSRGQESADPDILKRLKTLGRLVNHTIKTTRRISQELRPGILDDLGLKSAIEWQVSNFKKRSESEYKLNLKGNDENLSKEQTTTLFRITQESLTNIVRHAGATIIKIDLKIGNPSIKLEIKDNGKGISKNKSKNHNASFGIFGMKERASILGGELKIVSAPEEGTSIVVELPIQPN